MCGLVAIFNYKSPNAVSKEELINIRDSMYNRGPDGSGEWISQKAHVGLAHRRLSIIDLSDAGTQPMNNENGTISIVYNGEIYNYLELQESLRHKGYKFRTTCDTEVLIYLYQEYGQSMTSYLRGMFAFVIYDHILDGVFIVRDHFGIKPLYYSDDGYSIKIASQVKALLKGKNIDTSLEPAGQVGFYLWGTVPEPFTLYRGIRALLPGTAMWIDTASGNRKQHTYFDIRTTIESQVNSIDKFSLEQLHTKLQDSVKHHMISDAPLGLFLSSGLDSTTLVALARESTDQNISTFTLGFKEYLGTNNDETILAELVAKQYNTKHSTQVIAKENYLSNIDSIFCAMDQPSIDGVNSYFVCKGAKESGMKVVLSGIGGDELFAGYSTFTDVPRMVNKFSWANNLPLLGKSIRVVTSPIIKQFTSPKYAGLLEYGTNPGNAYLLRRGLYMPWELHEVLDAEIIKKGWHDLNIVKSLNQSISTIKNTRLQITALEYSWYMKNQLLRDGDWASMAHSLELRVPLVDIELFKYVTSLVKNNINYTKLDMARSLLLPLPNEILNRRKTGFSIPVAQWLSESQVSPTKHSRGLKGWAKVIFDKFT